MGSALGNRDRNLRGGFIQLPAPADNAEAVLEAVEVALTSAARRAAGISLSVFTCGARHL